MEFRIYCLEIEVLHQMSPSFINFPTFDILFNVQIHSFSAGCISSTRALISSRCHSGIYFGSNYNSLCLVYVLDGVRLTLSDEGIVDDEAAESVAVAVAFLVCEVTSPRLY